MQNQNRNHTQNQSGCNFNNNNPLSKELLINALIALTVDWSEGFGNKFKIEDWTVRRYELWATALEDLRITKEEFMIATRKSLTLLWTPNSPAEFLQLARGNSDLRYMESSLAYAQAANGKYSHPICYEAAKRVGLWNMRNLPEYATKKDWAMAYKAVCDEYSKNPAEITRSYSEIARQSNNGSKVLECKEVSLERESAIAADALNQIRNIL